MRLRRNSLPKDAAKRSFNRRGLERLSQNPAAEAGLVPSRARAMVHVDSRVDPTVLAAELRERPIHPAPPCHGTHVSDSFSLLVQRLRDGDPEASRRLFELVYSELRARARDYVGRRSRDESLNATGLVHEAFLKFIGSDATHLNDRGHLMALLSQSMRQILTDHVRKRGRVKRIPPGEREPIDEVAAEFEEQVGDLEKFELLLAELREESPDKARAVDMRIFGGMSMDETAAALDEPPRTFDRTWREVKLFFAVRMDDEWRGAARVG